MSQPVLDKARIAVGLHGHTKLDVSSSHVTTSNFMQLQPVFYRHMMPNEKLSVNAMAFARLAPLAVPTYGRCRLNMRAFFVPFRTVMLHFNDFIVDTVSQRFNTLSTPSSGIVTSTPLLPNLSIYTMFMSSTLTTSGSSSDYDFEEGGTYYKYTYVGRLYLKILRSLGYEFIPSSKCTTVYSALALLAYLRVFVDWYSASAYMDYSTYQLFLSWFRYDDPSTPLTLDATALASALAFVQWVYYDGDYLTAAWDSPVAPNPGLFSALAIPDITNNAVSGSASASMVVTNDRTMANTPTVNSLRPNNGTPFVGGLSSTGQYAASGVFTQYTDDALKALTDYMKRHQLAGARTIDRYLADYGINLSTDKLDRSTYLGLSTIDIRIGDVMSHADTATGNNPSNLGDYAGQGIGNGTKTFEFMTKEFGIFIICSSIMPSADFVQGYDRNNLHTTKDQFFNPDFDCLGVQTINKGEVYISPNAGWDSSGDGYDYAFGYTPRYAEYKIGRSHLTGDISLKTVLAGGDSWHLFRMFDQNTFSSLAGQVHSFFFTRGNDCSQYSRIFNSTDSEYDKFYLYYDFQAVSHAKCYSLFDTYQFEETGNKVTLEANGTKMN